MSIETFIKANLPQFGPHIKLPFDVEEKNFPANTVITQYGQKEDKIMLLCDGLVQVSTLKGDEEKILEFVFPGVFFGAYTSFILQQPSDVQITSLAMCSVTIIHRLDLLKANETSLLANQMSLYIAQQLFLSRARREKEFITMSAEERYRHLLEKNRQVVGLIPGNKISKYLGIKAESLSRIRKSIAS